MEQWYYSRHGERIGPVYRQKLSELAAAGQLAPGDLVWRQGMTEWTAAGAVPGLLDNVSRPETPVSIASLAVGTAPAAVQAVQPGIAYYNSAIPLRAQETLRGHAAATGDVGTWPLDEAMIAQWRDAIAVRKKIFGAAQLLRLLFVLALLGTIAIFMIGLFTFAMGRTQQRSDGLIFMGVSLFYGAVTVLYFFLYRGTLRSQFWAPLTFSILIGVGLIAIWGFGITEFISSNDPEGLIAAVLGSILPAIFLIVSIRATIAIRPYRRSPAWCQELVAIAKL